MSQKLNQIVLIHQSAAHSLVYWPPICLPTRAAELAGDKSFLLSPPSSPDRKLSQPASQLMLMGSVGRRSAARWATAQCKLSTSASLSDT